MTAALTPDPSTRTRTPLRARPAVIGQAARVSCWTGRGRRHVAEFSKRLTRYRLGGLSRTVTVSDPRLQNLLVNVSCNAIISEVMITLLFNRLGLTPKPKSLFLRPIEKIFICETYVKTCSIYYLALPATAPIYSILCRAAHQWSQNEK